MSSRTDDDDFNVFAFALDFLAGSLLITSGMIAAVYGASELLFSGFGKDTDTLIHVSAPVWGILHIVAGLGLFAAGCNIFLGRYWARMVGIGVSAIVLIAGLLSFPEGPVFAVFLVVLNAAILWALCFHWKEASFE